MTWIPTAALAEELGVHRRTIARWVNRNNGFPLPRFTNGRYYFVREEIEAWKKALPAGSKTPCLSE
jgi:excisionase family DNA binding protein